MIKNNSYSANIVTNRDEIIGKDLLSTFPTCPNSVNII